jgi:beta-glucanase (GH16 family)
MRKPLVVLAALAMTAGLLGASSTSSSAASSKISVRSSVKAPWPGEATKLTGRATPKKRAVELQQRRGKRWVRIKRAKTRAGGAFSFSVRASATRTAYRVVAPKTKIKRKVHKKKQSKALYVKQVSPRVSLSVTPLSGAVRVTPARAGAPVLVQRKIGTRWGNVVSTKLPATGLVEFQSTDAAAVYRVGVRGPGATKWVYSAQTRATQKLKWSEDFSDASTLGTTWQLRDEKRYYGKRMCSATFASNTYVSKGQLRLKVTQDTQPDPTLVNVEECKEYGGTFRQGMVGTQLSKSFTHGVFAARVKFQAPGGMHGGFWLQSAGTPEIDVAEYFGDGRPKGGLAHFLHPQKSGKVNGTSVGGENLKAKALLTQGRNTPATGFHVYSVEWTPSGYVFRVDGVETLRTTQLRSDDPHYLVLSLLSSDDDRKKHLDKSKLPQAFMDVDWVRVWQ